MFMISRRSIGIESYLDQARDYMIDPFERGKVWFLYSKLEREFIETASYVALETVHNDVWSERYGELLVRTGNMVDSTFRYMVNSKSLDNEKTVKELRRRVVDERKKNANWSPNITDFRAAFEPIFQLSSVEVEADYGLTYYGKLMPFKDFDKKSQIWWDSYNKVKHELFEQIEKRATLENTINALAGLFILNILHKESRKYLIGYTDVIFGEYMSKRDLDQFLIKSFVGAPRNVVSKFIARTPLFVHTFRYDKNVSA